MSDSAKTSLRIARKNALLLLGSMLLTFIVMRSALFLSPDSDFSVGGYNIHHLFSGLLLIAIGGIPLAIFRGSTLRLDFALVSFGIGLGMALDEWVYLIATDGSNASYLLPVSFWGGVAVVGLASLYTLALLALSALRAR